MRTPIHIELDDPNIILVALLVYVSDILLTNSDLPTIDFVEASLSVQFKLKDLGLTKFFLGMEIAHSQKGISLSRKKYTLKLIRMCIYLLLN